LAAALLGIGTGAITLVGQKYLPGSWNALANSGAVWLIPAYFIAARARTRALGVAYCALALASCVFSYYAVEALVNAHSFPWANRYLYVWLGCALVGGPVFGMGARLWREKGRFAAWGAALLPAVFLAEGLNELFHIAAYSHMIPAVIGRIAIGLILSAIVLFQSDRKKRGALALFALTGLGLLGYELLFRITG
jgi:hypothetical protein